MGDDRSTYRQDILLAKVNKGSCVLLDFNVNVHLGPLRDNTAITTAVLCENTTDTDEFLNLNPVTVTTLSLSKSASILNYKYGKNFPSSL